MPLTAAQVVTALMRGIKDWRWSSDKQEAEKGNREEKTEEEDIGGKGGQWDQSTLSCMGRNAMMKHLAL